MEIKSANELHELINSENKLILVDFFATWCGPCKMLSPILEEVAEELKDKLVIVKVDVDKVVDLTAEYRISAMPTLVFIKDKQEIGREMGFMSKDDLIETIEENYLK